MAKVNLGQTGLIHVLESHTLPESTSELRCDSTFCMELKKRAISKN